MHNFPRREARRASRLIARSAAPGGDENDATTPNEVEFSKIDYGIYINVQVLDPGF